MNKDIMLKLATPSRKLHLDATLALKMNLATGGAQVQELTTLLRRILSDENFITLLRAEGLITIPSCLAGCNR